MVWKIKKKGISLIEIIISIAILAIIIVPMSNVIIQSIKTNKSGEDKQQAAYITQQVLEGLGASDKLEDSTGFTQQTVTVNGGTKTFTVASGGIYNNLDISGYTVKLNLKRNTTADLADSPQTVAYDSTIEIDGNDTSKNITFNKGNTSNTYTNISGSNLYITVKDGSVDIKPEGGTIYPQNAINPLNNIGIKVKSTYTGTTTFNLHIQNNKTSEFTVYLEKTHTKDNKVIIVTDGGTVTNYSVFTDDNSVKNYDVDITVSKGSREIYKVKSNIKK